MLPVLQEPECLRLKKKKKKSLMSCPYCRVSPGDWVTRGGWPGQCSHPWGIQPFFWVSLLLFVGTAHSPVLWKMAFLSAVLLCPSRHSQKEESSYGEMQKATRSSCNSVSTRQYPPAHTGCLIWWSGSRTTALQMLLPGRPVWQANSWVAALTRLTLQWKT